MYRPTPFLTPHVVFTNPHTTDVVAWHQAAADVAAALVAPLAAAGDPTRRLDVDAVTVISDHQTLNHFAGDGWTAAAGDQRQLSVDDQLTQDGIISGHVGLGITATQQDLGNPPEGIPVDLPPPPGTPGHRPPKQ